MKKLVLSDEWSIGRAKISNYGQEYSYTTKNEEGETISSGVAAYEPMVGNEENTMREPMPYEEQVVLAPSNYYYTVTPLGESLFAAPVAGYREV